VKLWSEWITQKTKEKSTFFSRLTEIKIINITQAKESKQKLKNI
jgi:hypothetical protein